MCSMHDCIDTSEQRGFHKPCGSGLIKPYQSVSVPCLEMHGSGTDVETVYGMRSVLELGCFWISDWVQYYRTVPDTKSTHWFDSLDLGSSHESTAHSKGLLKSPDLLISLVVSIAWPNWHEQSWSSPYASLSLARALLLLILRLGTINSNVTVSIKKSTSQNLRLFNFTENK